jgi:tetratricopeptide (TPR) repeat protein
LGSQPVATTAAPDPGANATSYFGAEEPASAPNNLAALPAAAQIVNQVDENPEVQGNLASMPSLKAQYDRAVTVLQTASTKSVDTLAGDVNTKANEYIRQGEEAARNGKYYEAASLYRMAAQTEPDNPLIRIGLGHALAAAGEYLTAVLHLTQAIDHYPAFGYLNFELQNFVPDSRILDIRRADLERLLDKKEDYQLRFLLGYMEFYSGLEKFGVPNLEKAAHAAPAGSVIARFPSMIEKRAAVIPNPEKPQ